MTSWTTIESYVRLDSNGYVHNVSQRETDGKVEWVLTISKTSQEHTFPNVTSAMDFSTKWEDKITAERAEEAAEAAKWPKMSTKTIRRFSWDANKKVQLETKAYQPKFGEQRVGIYLDGEFLGVTVQDLTSSKFSKVKEPWKYLTEEEIKANANVRLHWRRYSSQAEVIRKLIDAYEKRTGKFID